MVNGPLGDGWRRLRSKAEQEWSIINGPLGDDWRRLRSKAEQEWSMVYGQLSMGNHQWFPYRDEVERDPSRLPSLRQVMIHEPHLLVKVSPEQERISPVEATLKE